MTGTALIPAYDQVIELPRDCGPVLIPAEFQDENGHMNVRHYYDLCLRAVDAAFLRIGITDDYRATRTQGFFTAEHHLRYYTETHVGDQVSVHLRFLERSDKVVHAMAFLLNDTNRQLACTLELVGIHVDLTTRSAVSFATDVARSIDRESAASEPIGWSAPVCGAMGIRR